MSRPAPQFASRVAAVALAAFTLGWAALASAQTTPAPATEQVLLGAPDPSGPTTRGVFLADPAGQIEHLVAVGHLLAWTVRTPGDTRDPARPSRPKTLPATTRVVIVDERGGAPLTVDYPGRWISGLQAFRGPTGPADPRIAVRNCSSRKASSCKVEVLALTPNAPLTLASRRSDRLAAPALRGRVDSGRELVVGQRARQGKRRACLPRLSIREISGGDLRQLRMLPRDPDYRFCFGLGRAFIFGRYAFAEVDRGDSRFTGGPRILYRLDLSGGPQARWHDLGRTFSETEYTDYVTIGPGVTDAALFFETAATDEITVVDLARISHQSSTPPQRARAAEALSTATNGPACAIAATDDAIYELTSPRCGFGTGVAGAIHRAVNPAFGALL